MPHTPGPWEKISTSIYAGTDGACTEIVHGVRPQGKEREEERDANARLIAAAPDLLAAAESLLGSLPVSVVEAANLEPEVAALGAAILRARGEE